MDPISAIFVAYLDMVSSSVIGKPADESRPEPQVMYVEHKRIKIPFTYKLWKIDPQSVCNAYNSDINTYSECAVAAKSLFSSACNYLESNPSALLSHRQQKSMYCDASISYEPAMTTADWSQESTPLSDARSECNLAIAALMRNTGLAARMKKEQECGKYDAIKAKQVSN